MMRKLIILLALLALMPAAFAAPEANIKIAIKGSMTDNRFFLCMPDLGCLSILAAKKGKIYKISRAIDMNTLFITDTRNMRVYNQGMPTSCDVMVKKNHTITISGQLVTNANGVQVKNLHCKLS